ncbi:hypothetical protein [Actinomyces sp. MRS3W]|uniref:hypothetical protein n=1 Tax=Actinomyces sp. MRS3W TaxID=2800796 RepID=UPI0028FD7E91|nr:hypothetical protein [Actinomyces sp. MRS3W]MDU0347860.1 hypothetical protein [Actinomyces sp. MRS3W]
MSLPRDFDDDDSFPGSPLFTDTPFGLALDEDSGMVDNLKKQAIETVKNRVESAQGVLAANPSTSPLAKAISADATGFQSSSVLPAAGLSAFSGRLAEVWSSPLADEIGTSIDTSVTAIRDLMDDIYEKASNAYWREEDKVSRDSDEADPKWK